MHISICVKEILEFFDIQPGQKGLDATLGYGGHTLTYKKDVRKVTGQRSYLRIRCRSDRICKDRETSA